MDWEKIKSIANNEINLRKTIASPC